MENKIMEEPITALLAFTRTEPLHELKIALANLQIKSQAARTCGEAALYLWSQEPPHLVFTDTELADGSWKDILHLAAKALAPLNVIVVSPIVDIDLYIRSIELGAFDFMVPPFGREEVGHVVRTAEANVRRRRKDRNQLVAVAG
jgi:DNA-binding NtrC family response regulator